MKKAYFQYYETFEDIIEKFKDLETREHFRKAIINYGLHGTVPEGLNELEDMAWTICKDLIDAQLHRREVNAQNRQKAKPAESKPAEQKKEPKFKKPTLEEIKAYCKEKNYAINTENFLAYYEANGWKIGRNAMKSWQAAVASWNARDKATGKTAGTMWAKGSADEDTAKYEDMF